MAKHILIPGKHAHQKDHRRSQTNPYINTRKSHRKLKKELNTEDIIVMKVDENKAMVLIDRKQGMDKVHKFQKTILFQLSNRNLQLNSKIN